MFRAIMFCALTLAAVPAARAGELDCESAPAATPVTVTVSGGSELDRESPQSAHGWRYSYGPYYGGWGWGGFYPRVSYFNYGFAPAFYSYYSYPAFGFYGYYNSFAYRPYFPVYYSPFGYGYRYRYWW